MQCIHGGMEHVAAGACSASMEEWRNGACRAVGQMGQPWRNGACGA